MLWVDCRSYYGPDRRVTPSAFRLRERRHKNLADAPPVLGRALRELRLHVLDAQGSSGLRKFIEHTRAVAALAEVQAELDVVDILTGLSESLVRGHDGDPRPFIYEQLDRLYRAVH